MIAEDKKQEHRGAAQIHLLFDSQFFCGMRINRESREPFAQGPRLRKKTVMEFLSQSVSPVQRSQGDKLYQVVTIAAMVIVLVSVWVF